MLAVTLLYLRMICSCAGSYHPEISRFHWCLSKLLLTVVRLGLSYILGILYFGQGRGCLFDALYAMYFFVHCMKCKGHFSANNVVIILYKFLRSSNRYPGKHYRQNDWNTGLGTCIVPEILETVCQKQVHIAKQVHSVSWHYYRLAAATPVLVPPVFCLEECAAGHVAAAAM